MNREHELLPIGTIIVSLDGERAEIDGCGEVSTGPMATGLIDAVLPEQENCYSAAFPVSEHTVSVFLSARELADGTRYQVQAPIIDQRAVDRIEQSIRPRG